MEFLKTIFLLSLLVSFSIAEVYAGLKRIFEGEPKSEAPRLTVEEQTNLNRAVAERAGSDEDDSEDEEENPCKVAQGNEMPHIAEVPSQAASEGQETASSSSRAF